MRREGIVQHRDEVGDNTGMRTDITKPNFAIYEGCKVACLIDDEGHGYRRYRQRDREGHQTPLDRVDCVTVPEIAHASGYLCVVDVLHRVSEVTKVEKCGS